VVGGTVAAGGVPPSGRPGAGAMPPPAGGGRWRSHPGGRPGPADTVYLGVYRRAAIERVGGYDETYQVAEDWEMNHRIRLAGGLIWFHPEVRVTYRQKGSVRAL